MLLGWLKVGSGALKAHVGLPGAARDFSPSQLPVQTLSRCSYSPLEQSHTLTYMYVCMLKVRSTGNHRATIVWSHENAEHSRSTLEDGTWLPKWQGN